MMIVIFRLPHMRRTGVAGDGKFRHGEVRSHDLYTFIMVIIIDMMRFGGC